MAHYAEIDRDNRVLRVIAVDNSVLLDEEGQENGLLGAQFCYNLFNGGRWIQTSYNKNFRGNYAGIDFIYDEENDVFYEKQPFPSWTLNETTWKWEPPVPRPDYEENPNHFVWNEAGQEWVQVTE